MLQEVLIVKRYLGDKFGYGEPIKDGVYAVPCNTYRGPAFIKYQILSKDSALKIAANNFRLYWDEQLTIDWRSTPERPNNLKESDFAKAFREIESLNNNT